MRFWRRSLFGFIDLLRIWNITISSIIYPCCLVSKQRPWERLLCFVDKTPKKWGQFWNNRTKHFVITPSKYSIPASLQQQQQAPISSTFCSFGLCLVFFANGGQTSLWFQSIHQSTSSALVIIVASDMIRWNDYEEVILANEMCVLRCLLLSKGLRGYM